IDLRNPCARSCPPDVAVRPERQSGPGRLRLGAQTCVSAEQAVAYAFGMKRFFLSTSLLALLALAASIAAAQAPAYDRYGHALVMDQQGWVYVDRDQRPLLRPFIYDNGPDYYEEGLARFVDGGKMGFHNEALHIVVPAIYDFAFPFINGVSKVGTHSTFH